MAWRTALLSSGGVAALSHSASNWFPPSTLYERLLWASSVSSAPVVGVMYADTTWPVFTASSSAALSVTNWNTTFEIDGFVPQNFGLGTSVMVLPFFHPDLPPCSCQG